MKKRLLSLLLTLALALGMLPAAALAVEPEDGTVTAWVTISVAGETKLAYQKVTAADQNGNGAVDIGDVLYAAHETYYEGGAAGYGAGDFGYGLSLTMLWGATDGVGGYRLNDAYVATSLAEPVKDGDYIAAYTYADTTYWSDAYSYFDRTSACVQVGEPLELTLNYQSYDESWNLVDSPLAGAVLTVDGEPQAATTDETGKAALTFEAPGTYLVSAASDSLTLVPPVCVVTVEPAAEAVTAYVTISVAGETKLAYQQVAAADQNGNGAVDIGDVLYAAHEAYYEGGAAGYGAGDFGYGLSLTMLWGATDGVGGYRLNDAYVATSLAEPVEEGDYIAAYTYADTTYWSDAYSYFDRTSAAVKPGEALELTLNYQSYDESWNLVDSPLAGAVLTVDGELQAAATDETGKAALTFEAPGTYLVSAASDSLTLVPPVCVVTVAENADPGEGSETDPDADQAAADAVEAQIAAIGTVTLDSGEAIAAARAAYDALTEAQKKLVENYAVLTEAELTLAMLRSASLEEICRQTGDYLAAQTQTAGDEWAVLGLLRSGREISGDYYDSVVRYVAENIDENGRLHSSKVTENARVILALTAAGYDATDVGGHNLLRGLTSMSYVTKQGVNGVFWTLLALDSHGYELPAGGDVTRKALLSTILDAQLEDGGWALSGTVSDVDMTAMAVMALAPYAKSDALAAAALDRAVARLSALQEGNGAYRSSGAVNAESCAQVIVALTAVGIDPATDSRFIKNGNSVLDALRAFAVEGGGFAHTVGGERSVMATTQGYYALAAYDRFTAGKTSLFDMSDVTLGGGNTPARPDGPTESLQTGDASPLLLAMLLLAVSAAGLTLVFRRRRG